MKRRLSFFSVFSIIVLSISTLSFLVFNLDRFPLARADLGASSGDRWAIIVGVSNYRYIDDLTYCDDDAIALYNQLAPSWGANNIELLTNSEANKTAIHDAIFNWLAPIEDSDDTVLIFFSGHGGQGTDVAPIDEVDGKDEYLCPYDSLTSAWTNDIRDDELDTWLNILDSRKIVVMLDVCNSGGFIASSGISKVEIDKKLAIENNPGLSSLDDGFAKDISKDSRVILTACAENESSWDSGTLKNGVFSHYIIDALSRLDTVDVNANHEISAEEIFNYVEPKVVAYTTENDTKIQHPKLYDGYVGEIPVLTSATITFASNPCAASLTVDGTLFSRSQLPKAFTWATNTVHTFNASLQAYEINEESSHPYPNNCNSVWNFTRANAASMRVHFNYIRTEKNYDYVRVLDNAGRIYANYTGNYTDMWSPTIPGNTIQVRLTSDYSRVYDGFFIDNLEYINSQGKTTQDLIRYKFRSWDDGNSSISRTLAVAACQVYTATYKTEYYLNVTSPYVSKGGDGWYESGATANATLAAGTVDYGNGTRRAFVSWGGDATGTNYAACPIFMDASKTATANWKTQYQVSFASNTSGAGVISPSGNTWVDAGGSPISISATPTTGYSFTSWTATSGINIANLQASGTTAIVTTPGIITANFTINSGPPIPELTSNPVLPLLIAITLLISLSSKKKNSKTH